MTHSHPVLIRERISRDSQSAVLPMKNAGLLDGAAHNGAPRLGHLLTSSRLPIRARSEREYAPGESVFLQGHSANAIYYIERGEVRLSVVSKSGKQAIVEILADGAFFGEGCLAGEPVRIATAVAVQPSWIIRLEKSALLTLFRRVPSVAEEFMTQLASRNLRMQADLADHIFNSSEKRLARLLLNMAKANNPPALLGPIPRVSQETLAEIVGTTRPRVSFFLNRFRDCGFISYDRNVIQVHPSLLDVLSGDTAISA